MTKKPLNISAELYSVIASTKGFDFANQVNKDCESLGEPKTVSYIVTGESGAIEYKVETGVNQYAGVRVTKNSELTV